MNVKKRRPGALCMRLMLLLVCGVNLSCGNSRDAAEYAQRSEEYRRQAEKCRLEKENQERLANSAGEFSRLPARTQLTEQPYLKGRMLLLRRQGDGPYAYAPATSSECQTSSVAYSADVLADIRAWSPEEVESVALVDCRRERRGTYVTEETPSRRLPAYISICDLSLIDRTVPAIIHRRSFTSQNPGRMTSICRDTTEVVEPPPYIALDQYLLGLPRR